MDIKKSNVYTKGGDKGKTSLLGGRRVPKYDVKIEAYGTIDELMANCSLLREMIQDNELKDDLLHILDKLMSAASLVAADGDDLPDNMPSINEEDITFLEKRIDLMDHELPTLSNFILPGGNSMSSQAHVARTVCRRAERNILRLAENEAVQENIIKYFNRLSDYYFLLARKLAVDSGENEIPWKP